MWNKNVRLVVGSLLMVMLVQSCSVYNTLFPKRQDNYINYSQLFSDSVPSKTIIKVQDAQFENKIRVITINKITNDTIVEWVDPIEFNNGKKLVISVKEKEANVLDTVMHVVSKESEILQPHKAIVFRTSDEGTNFSARNDTLFVSTSKAKMENVLLTMLGKNAENTPMILPTNPAPSPVVQKPINGRQKINQTINKIKRKVEEKKKTNSTVTVPNAEGMEKSVTVAKSNDDSLVLIERTSIPTQITSANSYSVVGDLSFDTDPNATLIEDPAVLTAMIESKMPVWNTFKCKAKVKLKTNGDNKSFSTNFRLKKNTDTWASVYMTIIGELARAYATPDSIMLMNKLNDKYYNYNTSDLQQVLGLPIAYSSIQDYILGNAPSKTAPQMIGKKNDKGFAIKLIEPGMSTVLTYNVDSTLKSVVVIGNANQKSYSMKYNLSDYEQTEKGMFSTNRYIYMLENGKETIVQLELSKIEYEQALEFPFTVPAHFKNGNKEKLK
jgi:Domain of unknown function (DUF4292)